MAAVWSKLQVELLELILENLTLTDHARFASVCSSWRSVAVENPPTKKPLYLSVSHDPVHLIRRFITSYIPSWRTVRFIGALDGWVVTYIDEGRLFLLNKGFNSMIPLPPAPDYKDEAPDDVKVVLSSPPSSGECTVVLKVDYQFSSDLRCLYYCRLGVDNHFSKFLDDNPSDILDFLFYKGQLYVLCEFNTIIIFDHLLNKITEVVAQLGDRWLDPSLSQLLISENKLWMISQCFCVFEFEESESRIIWVENTNNLLLLINDYCSLSTTIKEFRRENRYYRRTVVIDPSGDSSQAKVDDPWLLFFEMFNYYVIKNLGV